MTDEHDDRLMQLARQLSRSAKPERDLWPGIADAIERPALRRRTPMLAQAAAVVLLVGTSSAITYVAMKNQTAAITVAPPEMLFEQASASSRYTLGPGFQSARDALVEELDMELERMPAESRTNIEASLRVVRSAIFETNAALEVEPDNTVLQGQLLRAYRNELALLRRVSDLSRNVMMRNDI